MGRRHRQTVQNFPMGHHRRRHALQSQALSSTTASRQNLPPAEHSKGWPDHQKQRPRLTMWILAARPLTATSRHWPPSQHPRCQRVASLSVALRSLAAKIGPHLQTSALLQLQRRPQQWLRKRLRPWRGSHCLVSAVLAKLLLAEALAARTKLRLLVLCCRLWRKPGRRHH